MCQSVKALLRGRTRGRFERRGKGGLAVRQNPPRRRKKKSIPGTEVKKRVKLGAKKRSLPTGRRQWRGRFSERNDER